MERLSIKVEEVPIMDPSRLEVLASFLLATILTAPAWGTNTALPGTLNYIEGQARIGDQPLNAKSVGSIDLQPEAIS